MTLRSLPANPYLKLCGKALGDSRFKDIADYAKYAVKTLLTKEIEVYGSLKLNIFDGIFFCGKSISELTRKKYSSCSPEQLEQLMYCEFLNKLCSGKSLFIYPIDTKRDYMLISPQKISAELTGNTKDAEEIQRKLKSGADKKPFDTLYYKQALKRQGELELKIGGALMKEALKNQAFVTRFNEETYFRGVDLTQLAEERLGIREKEYLLSFVILYSVAFFGLSYNDIYTVEEVFGFSEGGGIRSRDNVKTNSAYALKNDLLGCSDEQLGSMLEQMGQVLFRIPLPKLNPDGAASSACGYLLYCAAAQTGKTFLKIMESDREPAKWYRGDFEYSYNKAKERAELLSQYGKAAALCDDISSLAAVKGAKITDSPRYAQTEELEKRLREAENSD